MGIGESEMKVKVLNCRPVIMQKSAGGRQRQKMQIESGNWK